MFSCSNFYHVADPNFSKKYFPAISALIYTSNFPRKYCQSRGKDAGWPVMSAVILASGVQKGLQCPIAPPVTAYCDRGSFHPESPSRSKPAIRSKPEIPDFHQESLQATTPRNRLPRELEYWQKGISESSSSHEFDRACFQNPVGF